MPGTMEQTDHDLWVSVRDQGKAIVSLEKNQAAITTTLDNIATRLESLGQQVATVGQTPWKAIGFAATITMFVLGSYASVLFYAYSQNLEHVATSLVEHRHELAEHSGDGHPEKVEEKINSVLDDLKDIELQLDHLVPREEHDARNAHLDERHDDTRRRLERLEALAN